MHHPIKIQYQPRDQPSTSVSSTTRLKGARRDPLQKQSAVRYFARKMDGLVAEIRKIPPVTRILCASSLGITIPVLLNILPPHKVLFVRALVLKKFEARIPLLYHPTLQSRPIAEQIWRLFTSFFLGSQSGDFVYCFPKT